MRSSLAAHWLLYIGWVKQYAFVVIVFVYAPVICCVAN